MELLNTEDIKLIQARNLEQLPILEEGGADEWMYHGIALLLQLETPKERLKSQLARITIHEFSYNA